MQVIDLNYDRSKKLFAIPVMLGRMRYMSGTQFSPKYIQAIMYLDTGSNRTSIIDEEAAKLEIDASVLPREEVGGVGGMTSLPAFEGLTITILDSEGNPINIRMDKVVIFPSKIKKKIEKNNGIYTQHGTVEGKMFNLFGLDAVEKINGMLVIDMANKKGHIEVP